MTLLRGSRSGVTRMAPLRGNFSWIASSRGTVHRRRHAKDQVIANARTTATNASNASAPMKTVSAWFS